jgi:prepilin-type N-terminal cleavage/methylation domain-containing protein
MKPIPLISCKARGFTLVEMSVVICVLIALMSTGLYFGSKISEWQAGKEAAEQLRGVYAAQRMYLADHPTTAVADLTPDILVPYLPNNPGAMPTVLSLDDAALGIDVTVSPPVLTLGDAVYDPSGGSSDSLWDVGE